MPNAASHAIRVAMKAMRPNHFSYAGKSLLVALASSTMLASAAQADPIVLTGDYIKIGLNDWGTLGSGGSVKPGILYDGTGTATFNPSYDYLTPGSPFEGFVITGSNGTTFSKVNNNSSGAAISGTLTDYSGALYNGTTYDNRAVWTGTVDGLLTITNDYFFNTDSQKIEIRTTISALTDLTDLAFSRQIDPDAVAAAGDSSATNNFRGTDGVAETDLVYAEALVSKYVIGLHTSSAITHNSAVTSWTSDTASYLAGMNIGNGDNTIGLGFDIGALLSGESIVLDYSYIFGTDIASAVTGSNNIVGTRTIDELLNGDVDPVFGGGTLVFTATASVSTDLSLLSEGGTIDTAGYNGTLTGAISGDGALTKTGAGTLTLTGANSYTGGTTVSEGRLVGNTTSLQGDITNNATVEFAQAGDGTYAGAMSGSGKLVKTGAGTLTLSGPGSYTGGTDVLGGTLAIAGSDAIGSGPVTIGAATLKTGSAMTLDHAIVLTHASSTLDSGAHDVTLSGNLSGPGTLTKAGSGTLTLTGTNSQNGINVAGGVLAFASDAALGKAGSIVSIQEDTTLRTLADFTIEHEIYVNDTRRAKFDSAGHDIVMAGNITGSGNIEKIGAGTLTLTGSNANVTINVLGGRVVARSQEAIGGGGGDITLHDNGSFTAGANMTVGQALHVVGNNAVFDTGEHDVTLTGSADGNACLIKKGTGRLTLAAASSNSIGACVEQGTLSFNNVFEGNVIVETDGRIGGGGTIVGNVQASGVIAPGNSPGVLTVEGSVTQAAGSTLSLDIDGTTAGTGAGHYDTLVLTGADSVYTAGGTIQPVLRGITGDATNSFTPQVGQLFQVVTAEGGVEGSFAGLEQPSEGLAANTRFDVVYRSNAVLLAVTPSAYAAFGGSGNAAAAGRALDLLRGPAGVRDTSDAGRLLNGLGGLGGDRLALTLEQLSGSIHADAMDASTEALRAARRGVGAHLDTAAETGSNVWGSINRDHLRVNADRSGRGYSAETYTMLIGVDTHATADLTVGAALGYGNVKLSTAGLGEAKDEHFQGLLYGRWAAHGSYLRGTLAFGFDRYKVNREVALDSVTHQLNARTGGFSHALDLEAGHRFALGSVALTPFAGIAYDRTERDNFRESGDSSVALLFLSDNRTAWQARGGATLSTSFKSGATVLTPYANVAVTHELDSVAARIAPRLNGIAMAVDAASAGKTGVQGGVGLSALVSETVSLNAGYRYRDTSNARQHSVNAGVSFRW